MRDLLLVAALVAMLPLAIALPYVGVLLWSWVAFMSPHREVFGFGHDFQFNVYIAALTLAVWLFSKDPKRIPVTALTVLLLIFALWTSFTTHVAINPDWSYEYWLRTIKTLALGFAVLVLITSKTRVQALIWIIVISVGFFAVKGAGFLLATGGRYRVFGPEDSMIMDNNNLGLAVVFIIPLLNYLRLTSRRWVVSAVCLLVIAAAIFTVIGTYSRGGFIALIAISVAFLLKSRQKVTVLLLAIAAVGFAQAVMPSGWFERMGTIKGYTTDESFEGRLDAWNVNWNIARARPLTGGGFSASELGPVFRAYNTRSAPSSTTPGTADNPSYLPPEEDKGTAAHSVYFEVLGDHGFIGLAIYLLILARAWLNTSRIKRLTRDQPDLQWARLLADMTQVSFIGYLVAGLALSMAYYDVFLVVLVLTDVVRRMVEEAVALPAQEAVTGGSLRPRFAAARK